MRQRPYAATSGRRPGRALIPIAVVTALAAATTTFAHDFWLVPDAFAVAGDSTVRVSGRVGLHFPNGQAVQPTRVVDARIVGASGETKITDLSVQGTSLRLTQKPAAAGQYLVVVGLAPRTTRTTPDRLLRFLRAEGGAAEASRLERESALGGADSLAFHSASYAATVVQVGRGGPRAFNVSSGHPLQFVPLADPAHLHVGDTLHVRIVGSGKPVPGAGIDAGPAVDSATAAAATGGTAAGTVLHLTADANSVAHVPVTKAGLWYLRAAHASRRGDVAAREWDVARATYVFSVGASH